MRKVELELSPAAPIFACFPGQLSISSSTRPRAPTRRLVPAFIYLYIYSLWVCGQEPPGEPHFLLVGLHRALDKAALQELLQEGASRTHHFPVLQADQGSLPEAAGAGKGVCRCFTWVITGALHLQNAQSPTPRNVGSRGGL